MIHIDVINESLVLTDTQVNAVLPAMQTQVSRDLAAVWGVDATLHFVATGQQPAPGHWWIAVLDDSDQAGALGYHDLTAEGLPLAKVFAKTDQHYGLNWTVTLSHELLEMLIDPYIELASQVSNTMFYAYEVCDACEDDQFAYDINGVKVSDFVTPQWFQNNVHPAGTKFDYMNHIGTPLQLLTGGYIGLLQFHSHGWSSKTAQHTDGVRRATERPGSRRHRRINGRETWKRSEVHA